MDSTTTRVLAMAARRRARAEHAEWSLVIAAHGRGTAAVDGTDAPEIGKELGRREVTLEIAQALNLTENAVWRILVLGSEVRDRAPSVWSAFAQGEIDAARVVAIGSTLAKLRTPEAVAALEHSVVEYAATHTVGELRSWLKRLRARLEPEQTEAEAATALRDRRVDVTHNDDGTSWFSALLPTGVAIAIENRLRRAARALPKHDPETGERDRRTVAQKEADLVGHWLTSCTGTETDIRAEIAISIPATDLIGLTDGPGFTREGGEPVAQPWVRELARSEHTVLRRLVTDPLGQLLDTTVLAYRPPEALRQALHWRDGTCRVAGCSARVAETDLDHELAYDRGGTTSAGNLRCLCRKHHNMKSHGRLAARHLDKPVIHHERYWPTPPLVVSLDLVDPRRTA